MPRPLTTTQLIIRKGGGLVVRARRGGLQCLLVTSRSRPDRWILPKGTVDPGETYEQAARREISEEAGVSVRLVSQLGVVRRPGRVMTYFLYRYVADVTWPEEDRRQRRWASLESAHRKVPRSLRGLIALASQIKV